MKEVKCPRCGQPSVFAAGNPYRPFCSERCKLIDLGNWADEKYSIPVQSALDIQDETESDDSGETKGPSDKSDLH
jgi:endogenous inhibitor of DNA gyrase (YacG/DUF329 family)